jgi:hypothetical protein
VVLRFRSSHHSVTRALANFGIGPLHDRPIGGAHNLGLVMGMLTVGHALGAAGGTYLGGTIFDLLLRYEWAVSIALAARAGLFTLLIPDLRGSGHSETN